MYLHQKKLFIRISCLLIYFFMSAIVFQANAQLLENRLSIYLSFTDGNFKGDQWINQSGFIAPSLFSNFNQNQGIQLTGTYKLKPWLAPGMHLNVSRSANWLLDESFFYSNSGSDFVFIAPAVRFYSPKTSLGFFNRFSGFAELAAGAGQAGIELIRPIMTVENGSNIQLPMTESATYWGMIARIGAKFDINHLGGLHVSYSLHRNRIDGVLFNDRTLNSSQIEVGIHIRFLENKRFYY
jgi:hypothetical protein